MHYSSEYLFEKYIIKKNRDINVFIVKNIIEDLVYLQQKLSPFGVLNNTTIYELLELDIESLVSIHCLQTELFAIKFFQEHSKPIPRVNIFGFYA